MQKTTLFLQVDGQLHKGELVDPFKPVVPWPHVEGVEVDLNSIRLKQGEACWLDSFLID